MNRDAAFALGMLVLSGIFFAETFSFGEGSRFSVGAAVYPRYVLAVLAGLSAILLVRSVAGRNRLSETGPAGFDFPTLVSRYWRTVAIFASFALYAGFLPVIGFPATTVIFLVALQLILAARLDPRTIAVILTIAVGATGFVYVIFTEVLRVFLP